MAIDYDNEPYVSPEQQKLWDTLDELSFKFQELIEAKRKMALNKLIDESSSSEAKKIELNCYFSFRMEPNAYTVKADNGITYSLVQMKEIALSLLEDKTFFYNDYPLILNNLDPFFESITYEDIILAFHNYRLSQDDESLSHLAKLLGLYTKKSFEMDELDIEFPVSEGISSHHESILHLKYIFTFLDSFLERYNDKLKQFYDKYELKNEENYDFSSRLDNRASQSLGKRSPLEIRESMLTAFLLSNGNFDASDEIEMSWLLRKLYEPIAMTWLPNKQDEPNDTKIGIVKNFEYNELSSIQWPTFTDLYKLVENEYKNEAPGTKDNRRSCQNIIDCLNNIRKRYSESAVNEKIPITTEDFDEVAKNKSEIDTQSAFENIQMHIRLLFIALMVAEGILEFSADKGKMKWRRATCRKLCEIFTDEESFETIQDETESEKGRIIENESIANEKERKKTERELEKSEQRNDLFKSFLSIHDLSSIEEIMKSRLELLDIAKSIAPEDIEFLEEKSAYILELIKNAAQRDKLSQFVINLRKVLNSDKQIQVSEDVLHTLATAEFLFTKYATDEFAEQGFDYSSISALYYQAFENAYNELIWKKYANYLNNQLKFGESKYTTILQNQHRRQKAGCFQPSDQGYGFLPSREKDWAFYSQFDQNTKTTSVNTTCMYSPFVKFLEKGCEELSGFYEWFSHEISFDCKETMTANTDFMELLDQFRTEMSAAVDNRNNASHGGSEISMMQCSKDRETVLADLKWVRESNLGLIQQLINILNFCSK